MSYSNGKNFKENLKNVEINFQSQEIVYSTENPISPTGGVVGLTGNLAPDGSIVKVAGTKSLQFKGQARCFDCEEDAFEAVSKGNYSEGDVIVIRYEGSKRWSRNERDVSNYGCNIWSRNG